MSRARSRRARPATDALPRLPISRAVDAGLALDRRPRASRSVGRVLGCIASRANVGEASDPGPAGAERGWADGMGRDWVPGSAAVRRRSCTAWASTAVQRGRCAHNVRLARSPVRRAPSSSPPRGTMPLPPAPARQRAARACQRCNRRKTKCDAVQSRGPCSRCRMDRVGDCVLASSRRGTYDRNAPRPCRPGHGMQQDSRGDDDAHTIDPLDEPASSPAMRDPSLGDPPDAWSLPPVQPSSPSVWADPEPHEHLDGYGAAAGDAESPCVGPGADCDHHARPSLASMFEDFLEKNDHKGDGAAAQLGIILFGESSPLTFALKESNRGQPASLHDAGSDLSKSKLLVERARDRHPSHCSADDIAYLEAKGALTAPDAELQELLVAAFLDRFYPLYSIVNKAELLQLHRARNLPWILLHAICFIGATFCDAAVIQKSSFKSRLHARTSFYDRAKVLFDAGYETDKFILLQTVIMMSFWGPQMKSYWNPCSWVGFGVTIAEALGIHRSMSSAHASGKDKSLVKRLWWSLAVRDAYCAALLGRPFRIDVSQCDTGMLDLDDFRDEVCPEGESQNHALYQIQVARLSIIVRKIVERRSVAGSLQMYPSDLHELLNRWQAQVPSAIASNAGPTWNGNLFATSLKLLYHYHNILIHLDNAEQGLNGLDNVPSSNPSSAKIAESSAQMISSTASMLVTKQLTAQLPHEIFTGFFVAGIVFYRQLRQADSLVSQMARALLDNCQMLLNEVREVWDPAHWVMRIFEFLLSSKAGAERSEERPEQQSFDPQTDSGVPEIDITGGIDSFGSGGCISNGTGHLHPVDWGSPNDGLIGSYSDILLMSSFFVPTL